MDIFVSGSHLVWSYFGVDKQGWRCREVSDYHCTRVSWCLLQNNPEARKRAGQSQTLERGQAHSDVNWELNSQRCPASQGVTDPGSKLGPVTQVNHSHRSLLNSLGDHGPAQAEHGITKSKCTREGEPRKRQLRESKPPNTYSQTCTSQQEHRETLTNPTPSARASWQTAPPTSQFLLLWGADQWPSQQRKSRLAHLYSLWETKQI